jgi:predicted AAA+ superfamily ATPase
VYSRLLPVPDRSFFLFGPRGTGKSTWLRERFPGTPWFDLLDSEVYLDLLADPARLERRLPSTHRGWVVIDEVQRVPDVLNEVHRLIEGRGLRFAMTGSSARKLRRGGVNLLAGRALTLRMHPLACAEIGDTWEPSRALLRGGLPFAVTRERDADALAYLHDYVRTWLREEVQAEGLTRNLAGFARFLESASFSQAAPLNVTGVARDCAVERKVVEDWFGVLEDLLVAIRLPVFSRTARREVATHPKFFFFDAGVYRALRPRGPLDSAEEIDGAALETLLLQEVRVHNDASGLGYDLFHWRTRRGDEVDLVAYGERGLHSFDVKRTSRVRSDDLKGLHAFQEDYPPAQLWLLYGGDRAYLDAGVNVVPFGQAIRRLPGILQGTGGTPG